MRRFTSSEEYLARAERTIPLGSQTFSKSKTLYPFGVSPYFITHGKGSRVWDIDGNEYIDFINGLATINLGYGDPDVTRAVEEQLRKGVIFSLPHPLEAEVAELLVEMVPCAEMVRFGKNGSDVTAGAIRLARAFTGRDHVAVCGYHGWQDWYIGSTPRHLGVPKATRDLTHTFAFNDIQSLRTLFEQYPQQIAAVILEPLGKSEPERGFLQGVKELTHDHGALVIFDEMITGFRVASGGAQERYGVTPDLATFGKGLGNGFPISAVVGSRRLMKLMEEIFFSLTYAGDALSLAAASATLTKLKTQPVIRTMLESGERLKSGVQQRIQSHGVDHIVGISGHPTWTFASFKDVGTYTERQIQTLFMQEMLSRGILTFGIHFVSYAHSQSDIDRLLAVYDEVLPILKDAVDNKALQQHLRCSPLEPLFRVR